MKKRILTGDRPTGPLHLGHYFGALKDRVALQDEYDTFVIIADVQALTDNFNDPKKVRDNVYQVTMDNLAVGIDPEKSTIFIQSMIPQIAELTIFYANLVTIARLQRNPTVKEEIAQKKELFKESVTYGFLGYPISQAADITVFGAHLVPVGEDQLPQIEQTREIVRKFNHIYGAILVEPEPKIGEVPRLKGLDGSAKMSKSLNNTIDLGDEPETISKKVMKAITDPAKVRLNDAGHPEVCCVFYYHKLFSKEVCTGISEECKKGDRGCVQCKKELAKNIIEYLTPIRERRRYYEARPKEVEEILRVGTRRAYEAAAITLQQVKEKMFLDY